MTGKVIIIGASGVVGHAAAERFATAGWDVVGVSRRKVEIAGVDWQPIDLLDADACAEFAERHDDCTHVVYAALQESHGLFPGWTDDDMIDRNARMAANIIGPLVERAGGLEHVSLLHGTKAYGLHHPDLGMSGIHMPLRERTPRRPHRNFYFEQEGYLQQLQRDGAGFRYTTLRPTFVYGTAPGNNMNPMVALAVYGALQRELGEPLHFPGAFGDLIREAVDAAVIGDVLVWVATAANVDGEAFNVTNGDVFTWDGVWPDIADALGMPVGQHRPVLLAEWIPRHADVWAALVDRSGADGEPDADVGVVDHVGANSLVYADLVLGSAEYLAGAPRPAPIVNSTIKLRHAGFDGCLDTGDMFQRLAGQLDRELRVAAT